MLFRLFSPRSLVPIQLCFILAMWCQIVLVSGIFFVVPYSSRDFFVFLLLLFQIGLFLSVPSSSVVPLVLKVFAVSSPVIGELYLLFGLGHLMGSC